MGIDIKKEIRRAIDTGKVIYGEKRCKKAILNGEGKQVLVSSNIKEEIREEIRHIAGLAGMPYFEFEGTSMELGTVCGKPFGISVMVIKDMGKSKLDKAFS